jgi:diguanylate cyclase (GGDEF)-like protein
MARTFFTWEQVGPRKEERLLAGRVAALLWLTVLPMIAVTLILPGSSEYQSSLVLLLGVPAGVWGIACLLMPWERVPSPLFYHVPATLALPYIGALVALTGAQHSPFDMTLLMLIGFCAYFFTPRAAVPYILACVAVLAMPLMYEPDSVHSELPATVWVALCTFAAVGGVIIVGKQQQLALRDKAHQLSLRDSLTGLANRRALAELLGGHAGGSRQEDSIGLLLVDLDNFKDANTLHGFPAGDRVLAQVGEALRSVARSGDIVARLGGDEFAIVGYGVNQEGMELLAARALERIQHFCSTLDFAGLDITASAGWAVFPDNVAAVEGLLTVADLSLRAAKATGKNRSHPPVTELSRLPS